ncbi:MAG: NADH-quinone oxidoreductase subunit NuoK [Actinomycetes bacterium]|jgi:NADH-quinone oxidoreductase subunit K|nr:NADH-quinone oxidoreductase subunit NuoK [Actinomycetes bacterium]
MMPTVGLTAVVLLAAALFAIGLYGAISNDSAIGILISLEIMAISITVNLMGFARFSSVAQANAWFFSVFLMVITAAEIGIGLALVVAVYRRARTSEVDDLSELKG